MTNMNPETVFQGIDRAAAMNDRWLFIAILVAAIIGLYFVVRYFVKQHEQLILDVKEGRREHLETYKEMNGKQDETLKQLAVVVDRNSHALTQNTEELRRCRELRQAGCVEIRHMVIVCCVIIFITGVVFGLVQAFGGGL